MENAIKHNVLLPKTREEVWAYLTQPELIEQWLMKNDFKPVVGHDFQFLTNPLPAFNFDGIAYCKVLEVVPYKKLVYTWKGGPGDGTLNLDSVVTWTLEVKGDSTELQIVHTGFKELENSPIYMAMNNGWLKNMIKIGELQTHKK